MCPLLLLQHQVPLLRLVSGLLLLLFLQQRVLLFCQLVSLRQFSDLLLHHLQQLPFMVITA
jgi:hypothetical protein